jgi:hypothetical protein
MLRAFSRGCSVTLRTTLMECGFVVQIIEDCGSERFGLLSDHVVHMSIRKPFVEPIFDVHVYHSISLGGWNNVNVIHVSSPQGWFPQVRRPPFHFITVPRM